MLKLISFYSQLMIFQIWFDPKEIYNGGYLARNHLPGEIRLFNGLTTASKNDQAPFFKLKAETQTPLSLQIEVMS